MHAEKRRKCSKINNLPLLKPDLLGARAGLRGDELFQIPDGIIRVAFDSNLLSKTIVTNHLNHILNKRETETAAIDLLTLLAATSMLKGGRGAGANALLLHGAWPCVSRVLPLLDEPRICLEQK